MSKVIFGDVVRRANTKEDRHNTDKIYYVGGEHIESNEVLVENRGLIEGSTIGPMFYFGFKAGDILFVSRNPHLRKSGMVTFDGICSEKTFVLETKDESVLLQRYLAFVMQSDHFWSYMEAHKSGSVNFFINWSTLAKYEFELPDIEKQKTLSDMLWAISDTKKAYRQLYSKSDSLVTSRFTELFGNPSEWNPKIELQDICLKITDGSHNPPKGIGKSKNYMISSQNIHDNTIDYEDVRYLSDEDFQNEHKRTSIKPGDVLLTIVGAIGRSAVVKDDINITCQRSVCVIHPDKNKVDSVFLKYMLDSISEKIISEARGAAQKGIYLNQVKKLEVICPSFELQTQFVTFIVQNDKAKQEIRHAIDNLICLERSILADNFN